MAPEMAAHCPEPESLFRRGDFSWSDAQRRTRQLLTIGPAGASTYWHSHTAAYNMLLCGRKEWWLLPPLSSFGPVDDVGMDMRQWRAELRAWMAAGSPSAFAPNEQLNRSSGGSSGGAGRTQTHRVSPHVRPLQCTQSAGELLFVPAHWQHGVINGPAAGTACSVAVATELGMERARGARRARGRVPPSARLKEERGEL